MKNDLAEKKFSYWILHSINSSTVKCCTFTTGYPNLKTSKYFNRQWISFYQSDCKDHHWIQNGCNITVCTKYLSGRARRRNIWLQVITYGPSVAKVVWCSLYFYQQQHSSPQWSQQSLTTMGLHIHASKGHLINWHNS